MLKLNEVARQSQIPKQTLHTKLRRGTELKYGEIQSIRNSLSRVGLFIIKKEQINRKKASHRH
jgi:hypothetical protein